MCRVYNTIGSLTSLKSNLKINNIHDFHSLKDVLDFQNSSKVLEQQILSDHKKLIDLEKDILSSDLQQIHLAIETQRSQSEERLQSEINTLEHRVSVLQNKAQRNLFQKLIWGLSYWNYNRKLKDKVSNFRSDVEKSIGDLVASYQVKNNRYQFVSVHFLEAINLSAQHHLSEFERKQRVVRNLRKYIYGALGEQKVVRCLEGLSDDYVLINDFSVSFSPAIYNRQENDYIKSIQIDHILIGPSGVFLIETKNWSEKSIENTSFHSPVHQIKRTSFVLFKLLNNEMSNFRLRLDGHHWGDKKISIRNLLVMTNAKPEEEFQFVKMLTLNQLIGYVNYFKPSLSSVETQKITDLLLRINHQNALSTN